MDALWMGVEGAAVALALSLALWTRPWRMLTLALWTPFAAVLTCLPLVWLGLLPATLALLWGAVLRRWLPPNPFVYTLGRAFFGTAAAVFGAGVVYELAHHLLYGVTVHDALVARWLMAWADAFLTGVVVAVLVAFAPQYLATWSDQRYLRPPAQP